MASRLPWPPLPPRHTPSHLADPPSHLTRDLLVWTTQKFWELFRKIAKNAGSFIFYLFIYLPFLLSPKHRCFFPGRTRPFSMYLRLLLPRLFFNNGIRNATGTMGDKKNGAEDDLILPCSFWYLHLFLRYTGSKNLRKTPPPLILGKYCPDCAVQEKVYTQGFFFKDVFWSKSRRFWNP